MGLRSRAKISGPRVKPRATSLGRGAADRGDEYYDANATNVSSPSSPTTITWDGKFYSRVSPVQGGGTRASVPSARSESAGGAVRSPEGGPPRRPGKTWEHGDVDVAATYARQSSAAAVISEDPIASPDEGANFTQAAFQSSTNAARYLSHDNDQGASEST